MYDKMTVMLEDASSYNDFYENNKTNLKQKDSVEVWKRAFSEVKIKKSDVIEKADIGYTYFYDILRGDKHPTRNILIKLFLAAELNLSICQEILYTYDSAYLYPDVKRDSIVIFAINNHLTLSQTNRLLEKYNEQPLK